MRYSIRNRMIVLIVPLVCLILAGKSLLTLWMTTEAQAERSYAASSEQASRYANELDASNLANLRQACTLARMLECNTTHNRAEIMTGLENILRKRPDLIGVYVGFEPNAFDANDRLYRSAPGHDATGRFAPYWNRLGPSPSVEALTDMDSSDWYLIPKRTKRSAVIEPLNYHGFLMTSFVCPILKDGRFIGFSGVDVSLKHLDADVAKIKVFKTGYAFLVSNTGTLIAWPDKRLIGTQNLRGLAAKHHNQDLNLLAQAIQQGRNGFIKTRDPISGRDVVMFYAPLSTCKWGIVMVAPVQEIFANVYRLRNWLIIIGLSALILVTIAIALAANSLAKPIMQLSLAADYVAQGHLDQHVPDGRGEIGVLARAFNNMTDQLKLTITALEQHVNELKAARANQDKLIEELEIKNAELERFTYTVSHDLKSPLITIKGFLGYLEQDAIAGDAVQLKADIDRIASATDKMQQLLLELLELSRIGRLQNPYEEFELEALVQEAITLVAGRIKARGAEVIINGTLPRLYGDRPRIREVFENLIDNAVKYGGNVPHVEIGTRQQAGELVFYVQDNGSGIDPRYHARIFSLFEKLDPASEGTGMGLAIVKRIVEVHKGRIWVESDATGSTFCLTLPDNRQANLEEDNL